MTTSRNQIITILLLSIFIFSCKEQSEKQHTTKKTKSFKSKVNFNELETDFSK